MPIVIVPSEKAIACWILRWPMQAGRPYEFLPPDGSYHSGIHPSEAAIDALFNGLSVTLGRVSAYGVVLKTKDCVQAQYVRVEWTADASGVLADFAAELEPELYGPKVCPLILARTVARRWLAGAKDKDGKARRRAELEGRLEELLMGLRPSERG